MWLDYEDYYFWIMAMIIYDSRNKNKSFYRFLKTNSKNTVLLFSDRLQRKSTCLPEYIVVYIFIQDLSGATRGVMVTSVEMDTAIRVQILNATVSISRTLAKAMNSTILPQAMGK